MKELSKPFDLIRKSLTIFFEKNNFLFFLKLYLILLPFSIFSLFQKYLIDPTTSQPKNVWFNIIIVLVNLLFVLAYILVSASSVEAIRRVIEGGSFNIKDVLLVGWKKYWKVVLLGIILIFVVGLGFILLIIPGVMFMVWFNFSKFIIIEREVGVKEALTLSRNLVKGRFWKIFGRLIVFGIFIIVCQILLSIIPYLGSVVTTLFGILFILPSYLLYKEL